MKAANIAALAAFALLASSAARAETIVVGEEVQLRESTVARPARGSTMQSVEAKFGAPAQRHPAVGDPPITRWDYPGFSVFFEHQHVVHAVATAP